MYPVHTLYNPSVHTSKAVEVGKGARGRDHAITCRSLRVEGSPLNP